MNSLPRARRRVKLSHDEILRRLRLGDLRKLFADRCRGLILPDDDAGREYLRELLLPISLGPNEAVKRPHAIEVWGPTDRMLREIELRAPWMSADEARELIEEINQSPTWQRKPMAKTLGERLQVTFGERARLQLRTIGPCDMTEAAMALMRKQRDRKRKRLRRQLAGAKSRPEYLAVSLSRTKPWLVLGISRSTWERRRRTDRETGRDASPSAINLIQTEDTLASEVRTDEGSKACGRLPTPTPAGQRQTFANDDLLPWDDYEWLDKSVRSGGNQVELGNAA